MNYPPPDAIQEFRMQTSDFDAQYGFSSGVPGYRRFKVGDE